MMSVLRKVPREGWLAVAILAVASFAHFQSARDGFFGTSQFLSRLNLIELARQTSTLGIFALGAGIVIIAGGIDLSSGSVICFTAMIFAKLPEYISDKLNQAIAAGTISKATADSFEKWGFLTADTPFSTPMLATIAAIAMLSGIAVGMLHSLLINQLEIPPFVATLATMAGLRSGASLITTGNIMVDDERFRVLGRQWTIQVAIFLGLCVLLGFMMRWMVVGRHLVAMGGNEQAAVLSGLPVRRLKLFAYTLASTLAALAGLVLLADVGSAETRAGMGYELKAIAAAVVGGCNLKGGAGSILGIALGVLLLVVVINGSLFMMEKSATEWEGVIVGVVVIFAVLLGKFSGGK